MHLPGWVGSVANHKTIKYVRDVSERVSAWTETTVKPPTKYGKFFCKAGRSQLGFYACTLL